MPAPNPLNNPHPALPQTPPLIPPAAPPAAPASPYITPPLPAHPNTKFDNNIQEYRNILKHRYKHVENVTKFLNIDTDTGAYLDFV